MLIHEAARVIADIVMYDYNGDEICTELMASDAIRNAVRIGYSMVGEAPEAIETLGVSKAVQIYIDSWADRYSDEYTIED